MLTDGRPRHRRGRRPRPARGHGRSRGWPRALIDVAVDAGPRAVAAVPGRSSRPPAGRRRAAGRRGDPLDRATFLVYPTTIETLTRGKSLGKLALGLRVVRDDGGTVTVQQSFVRALVGIVEIYVVPRRRRRSSAALVSSRGKRLGDYAAGTYVVRDRVQPPAAPAHADAAGAGRLGGPGRHGVAAGRAGAGGPPVPRAAALPRPGLPAAPRRRRSPPRSAQYVAPPRRRAPRRRPSWPPSSRRAATATWPGCAATRRSGRG